MKTRLFSLLLVFVPFLGMACSCEFSLSFCETISPNSNIALGVVFHRFLHQNNMYINVEYIETIQGEVKSDTMTLNAGPIGLSCSISAAGFENGTEIIFTADEEIEDPPSQFPTYGMGHICSRNFKVVSDGGVWQSGELIPYEDFKRNFSDCSEQIFENILEEMVDLFPNPVGVELSIAVNLRLEIDFVVFNAMGQMIHEGNTNENLISKLDVSDYAAGTYFIRFRLRDEIKTERFVVH